MKWVWRIISLLALGVVLYLFWPLLGELREAFDLVKSARWMWLPITILVQLISYISLTWLNALALQSFPGRITFGRLMALLTSIAFIETAIPSAGTSGIALRARLLGKHGQFHLEASIFSLGVETIYEIIAIATVGIFGLVFLLRHGGLTNIQMAGLIFLVVSIGWITWTGWRLIWDPELSQIWLARLAQFWNRITGRFTAIRKFGWKDPQQLEERLVVFRSSLARMHDVPRWKFWTAAYGKVILDVATLGACFYLFNYPISIGSLITGYGLILLLSGLASMPGGLGLVDASVPVVFAGLGVQGPVALAAGLAYRLIAFWLLRFIGFISWQALEATS